MEGALRWYFLVAYFFGGAFLVNAVPHFVNGVSGRRCPTPFASPPGKGESSPTDIPDVLVLGAGGLLMAVMLARAFGRLYGGQ
jgi:hypothetical protein